MNLRSANQKRIAKRNSRIFYETHCKKCKCELSENEIEYCDDCSDRLNEEANKKEIHETVTGDLFNQLGILQAAGDYAGKYQDEAFELLDLHDAFQNNEWSDIMHDNKGTCYAIYAEDELTCQNAVCFYAEIEKKDCERAYNEAQTHLD